MNISVNNNGATTTYSSKLTGPGSLTLVGGSLTLSGNNTYGGGTILSAANGGTLIVGSNTALGAATGSLTVNSGTLDLNGHSLTVGALTGSPVGAASGIITNSAGGTPVLSIGDASIAASSFSGTISDGTGVTSLVKKGTGSVILSGFNTYTGTTTVSKGTLTLQGSNAIGQTSQVIMAGGTLGTSFTTQDFTMSAMPATLKVTANSTIDLGGFSSTVKFADSSGVAWTNGAVLRISGWNGTPFTGSVSDPEQLIVGTDTTGLSSSTQLSHIHFTGFYTGAAFASVGVNPGEVVPNTATILKGDVNQDGSVSVADVSALMAALTDISDYESGSLMFQGNFVRANHATALDVPDTVDVADIDGDGFLTNLDIQAEINLVASLVPPGPGSLPVGGSAPGGVTAVPEPASFVLLGLGSLILASRRLHRRAKRRSNSRTIAKQCKI